MAQRVIVDRTLCEGHALCTSFAPDVFQLDEDEKARVVEPVSDERIGDVDRAVAACPVQAIRRDGAE